MTSCSATSAPRGRHASRQTASPQCPDAASTIKRACSPSIAGVRSPLTMCGIIGQLRSDGRAVSPATMENMCAALEHRGPDSRGFHVEGHVGSASSAFASSTWRPATSRSTTRTARWSSCSTARSTTSASCGAPSASRPPVRHRRRHRGHRPPLRGDGRSLRRGAARHVRLRALGQARAPSASGSRPRRQEAPVLRRPAAALSFASELTALMQDPEIPRDADPAALDAYLAYRWVPAPASAFAAARKLPAATYMALDEAGMRAERYWRLDFSASGGSPASRSGTRRSAARSGAPCAGG